MSLLYDITRAQRHTYKLVGQFTTKSDSSNAIFPFKIDQTYTCENCNKYCLFLHHVYNKKLCPSCRVEKHGCNDKCTRCFKYIGCETCGGITKKMIEIDDLVLCANDCCLMPFGYSLKLSDNENCTCSLDRYNRISKEKIDMDTASFVGKYLNYTNTDKQTKHTLIDMTKVDSCLPCFIKKNYIDITTIPINRISYDDMCQCFK